MIFNESLIDFFKSLLSSIQKQGKLVESDNQENEPSSPDSTQVDKAKFKEILKLVLQLFWRLVSNNSVSGFKP